MKNVKLSNNIEIELKEELTWGDSLDLDSIVTGGALLDNNGLSGFDASAMVKAKYKLLEVVISKIKDGEKEIPFSEEFLKGLSIEDGNKLYNETKGLKGVPEAIKI